MDREFRGSPRWVWFVGLLGLAGLIALSLVVGWTASAWLRPTPTTRPAIADTTTLVRQVQSLNELTTVKYVLEKVIILQDVKWYGENRLLMIAHGAVRAGVNLNALRPADLVVNGTRVQLKLPRATITDVFLDDHRTQVVERTTGLLREFDKDLEQDARRQAVDQIRVAAASAGILKDADERARTQISALLKSLGFSDLDVTTSK